MAAIELAKLDEKGLKRVIAKAQRLLAKKEGQAEAKFLREMKKEAAARGLNFSSVVGGVGGVAGGAKKRKASSPRGRKLGKVAAGSIPAAPASFQRVRIHRGLGTFCGHRPARRFPESPGTPHSHGAKTKFLVKLDAYESSADKPGPEYWPWVMPIRM